MSISEKSDQLNQFDPRIIQTVRNLKKTPSRLSEENRSDESENSEKNQK